jgi:hypothetical protein
LIVKAGRERDKKDNRKEEPHSTSKDHEGAPKKTYTRDGAEHYGEE